MSRRVKIGDGKKKKAKMQGISGGDPGAASSGFIAWGVAALALLAALFFVVQYWVFTTDALKKEKKLLDGLDRAPVPGKPRLYTYEVSTRPARPRHVTQQRCWLRPGDAAWLRPACPPVAFSVTIALSQSRSPPPPPPPSHPLPLSPPPRSR
jgi:hypothetical protein